MCKCLGDGNDPPSVGDVIALLTGDALFGKASDRDTGLTIFFMSYTRVTTSLMKPVLAYRTKTPLKQMACPCSRGKRS